MANDQIELIPVREDFVPKDVYLSEKFARLEKEYLWPKVWQVVCREEEIPRVGDYVTYEVLDESFVIVRTDAETIKAYHNVCQHRGRRLVEGCGRKARLRCRFHGWTWNLDGSLAEVLDRSDWDGCEDMSDADLALKEPLIDFWQGFVFINMDSNAEPLEKYLDPVPSYCDGFEFSKMRFHWSKSVRLPCNWKVALEAFNEGYHVAATHPQLLDTVGDDRTVSFAFNKHGMFGYFEGTRPLGTPSPRTGKPVPDDIRPGLIQYIDQIDKTLNAIITHRDAAASRRLMTDASADDDPMELLGKLAGFMQEAAVADGAGWPDMSFEDVYKAGTDWHVFPNFVFLPYPDGALFYRSRPDGDNPDSCIYDIWALARFAPGAEPELKHEKFYGKDDWREQDNFGLILTQDFQNMHNVQRGMKSSGFSGARTNPKQEKVLSNFHKVLIENYLNGEASK
ncbi:Rieske 2Fe-2S domain-containing protein [Spongiibacter sp. KMU-166]|uniref:Rieske 2Fe-2S domain-containing protein n=1 Tax=Spongiibacter thalassae TaxID=2721624 RepID=A0ABX1GBK8_9GAMM|nr:SRPBCC family protein [Spongiibacter thalassae]NKI15983.1 Rieske 2Fe-2S domain-containing protein [Spongiibacter thalassae]